jgi:hypothetical protein
VTIIQQYLDYSSLSFASYGIDLMATGDNRLTLLNDAKMVQSQLDQLIASGWEVINQSSDIKYGSSGFSATLFHNTQTNEYVFAHETAGLQ